MISASDAVIREFKVWYQHEIPRLFNYVAYWVQDGTAAEDLTAAICEQALNHLHTYDAERGSLDAWMFGIARNALKMHFRSMGRRPESVSLDALPDIRSESRSTEQQVERAERFREVMHHLPLLSPQEQEALTLRFGAELSNPEIAQLMEISANQVGVVVHRALSKLRVALSEAEEVEG